MGESPLDLGLLISCKFLELLTDESPPEPEDVVAELTLQLPNSERQDSWFRDHPWMEGEHCAFEILDSEILPIQAKFYWLNQRKSSLIAGAVHFTENWEDFEYTRTDNHKIGIDFFLTEDGSAIKIALSNRGKLRILEVSERINNTQFEIFETWASISKGLSVSDMHSKLWESFRLQSLNAKFYQGVSEAFSELSDHLTSIGKPKEPSKLFASRLLGRLIFVWFIRKMALASEEHGYFECENIEPGTYYRQNLERLFFRTLNLPEASRTADTNGQLDLWTPYLNGGLFAPKEGDWVNDETVTFPNHFFSRLFAHFESFNFTTDESTPEYEQVAIDPEMLGRVFESLLASQVEATGEQARKAKGAFYTPRELVFFMCKESIREHLKTQLQGDSKAILAVDKLIETTDQDWVRAGSNSLRDIGFEQRSKISATLNEIKSLDPACGSGAFPLGMLHLLAKYHLRLEPKLDPYKLKLSILQNNIFGVDIEPMAIEISRLRSWLSIIIEEINRKVVEPLPNLEFNFVAANSLVSLPESSSFFENGDIHDDLLELRNQYFSASSIDKKKKIEQRYFKLTSPDLLDQFDDRSTYLKTFNPFLPLSISKFFDADVMFGVTDGFNIIVGNPPYIGIKGHREIFEPVKNTWLGQRFFAGKMDYFYFFYHFALDSLRNGGVASFVTTNYLLTATFANKLIDDIKGRSQILQILNFNEIKLFDSALGQHNLIMVLQKGSEARRSKLKIAGTKIKGKIGSVELVDFLYGKHPDGIYSEVDQHELFSGSQIKLTGDSSQGVASILKKMESSLLRLSDVCHINQGLITGADKASEAHVRKGLLPQELVGKGIFVLTESERDALKLDANELAFLKPYYKNSDIWKFGSANSTSRFVVYSIVGSGLEAKAPKLFKHLMRFEKLGSIHRSNFPYLRWPRTVSFDGPKIVVPQRSNSNTFGYNEEAWYGSADVYFITSKDTAIPLKAILGLLNSDLYFLWLYLRGKRKGEALELFQVPLSELPVPNFRSMDTKFIAELAELSDSLISTKPEPLDTRTIELINQKACEMFGLSAMEQKLLSDWISSRKG